MDLTIPDLLNHFEQAANFRSLNITQSAADLFNFTNETNVDWYLQQLDRYQSIEEALGELSNLVSVEDAKNHKNEDTSVRHKELTSTLN